jgi:hypothetical protein
MSVALDVPEETVVQHDRNLVMAGLRTKGGRGRSAPEVTPLDAARLLVATLASFRTKDSVATVKQFERAVFEPPDRPRTISFRGFKLHDGGASDASTFLDRAIASLPPTHNFIEALAALIADASRPVEDFEAFLKRFARIGVTCSSPSGRATIGGTRFVRYLIPIVGASKRDARKLGRTPIFPFRHSSGPEGIRIRGHAFGGGLPGEWSELRHRLRGLLGRVWDQEPEAALAQVR